MKGATATNIIPIFSAGHNDRKNKEKNGAAVSRPPAKEPSRMDSIDRFDEARMYLEAFLDGIYNTALAADQVDINTNTLIIFCSLAQERAEIMENIFEEIMEREEGEIDGK